MVKYDYDYLVIGGGSGGIASARRAASYGAKVALIEKARLGGTCVNVGCVPKKYMHYAALLGESIEEAQAYGWETHKGKFDWKSFKTKKDHNIARLNGIYEKNLSKSQVELVRGQAEFVDSHTLQVGDKTLTGEKILIATGGHPNKLGIPGEEHAINSDEFFELEHCPSKVIVVGAGYIGVELAGIFHGLGAEVTIVYRGKRILKAFDAEISQLLEDYLRHQGVNIVYNTHVREIVRKDDQTLEVKMQDSQQEWHEEVECVLMAVGRSPNIQSLQLQNTKVQVGKKNEVIVNEQEQTDDPAIYSVGDTTRKAELTPVAIQAGRLLADRLFNNQSKLMNYQAIPTAVFASLEIGACGLTEEQAIEQHSQQKIKIYRAKFTPLKHNITGHAVKMLIKLIVTKDEERILGMHLLGPDSAEIIQGFALAVRHGLSKSHLDDVVALHPTSAEEFVTMK